MTRAAEYMRAYRAALGDVCRLRRRERYHRRKEAGLCVQCGAAASDSQYCAEHEARVKETQRQWWARRKGRAA